MSCCRHVDINSEHTWLAETISIYISLSKWIRLTLKLPFVMEQSVYYHEMHYKCRLLSYKTCLDTKPVLYQDRFCSLTAVTLCMGCYSMGYGMFGFNGHVAAHTGSVVTLRERSVLTGTGPGNVPAWSRDLWQHIKGNLHLVRCNYGMIYLQIIMWTFVAW